MDIINLISVFYFFFIFYFIYKIFQKEKYNIATSESCCLTEDEKLMEVKTRKKWFISFVLMSLISVLATFSFIVAETGAESFFEEVGILLGISASTLPIIPWFWVTYYCSFKKRGTNWLSLQIVIIPLRYLLKGILLVAGRLSLKKIDAGDVFFFTLFLSIQAYYLFNCYYLRKINYRRKRQRKIKN